MRITAGHIIELAAENTSRAQSKVAEATQVASSGLRVSVPSDDPVAWAAAQRAKVREALGQGRATTLSTSRDLVEQTDSALADIQSIISQARVLAVEGASDSNTAATRADLGAAASSLFQAALAAANSQSSNGEYLLAGDQTQAAPFDAAGVYHGDAVARTVNISEQGSHAIGVPGSALTAANGVDVLPELGKLATALSTNNLVGIQAALGTLQTATTQVSSARGQTGAALSALNDAETSRQDLETHLGGVVSDLVEADTVTAASTLAQATQTLDAAQTVTAHVISSLTAALNAGA